MRRFQDPDAAIRQIHSHTRGHPFWLNVISTQIQRMPQNSAEIVEEMASATGDDRIIAMLRPVWRSLNDNQKLILHIMSESPKAEQRARLEEYALAEIPSPNQFSRAFKTLESLGLVVSKEERNIETRYEIHPVVRQFINQEFPSTRERAPYMNAILSNCGKYILRLHEHGTDQIVVSVETFEYSAIGTEMQLRSGDTLSGVKSISRIHDAFIARGYGREVLRLGDQAIADLDWSSVGLGSLPEFHSFARSLILSYMENLREESARDLIQRYSPFVIRGTADYVAWCGILSHAEWLLRNYDSAIAWGREGRALKDTSHMDTRADSSHFLNLALRDSGHVDEALPYFLSGHSVEDVVRLGQTAGDPEQKATFFGNVGRCLYLKGELRASRVCYARSADKLYAETNMTSIANQGWVGLWLGDVCAREGHFSVAELFYQDCKNVWSTRAPLLLNRLEESLSTLAEESRTKVIKNESDVRPECEAHVRRWLGGL